MFGGTGDAAEEVVVVVVVVASRMGELSLRQSHPLDRRESRRCAVGFVQRSAQEVTVVVDGEVAEDLTGVEIFCQPRCEPLWSWQNRTEGWVAVAWEKAQVVLHTLYTYVSHFRKGQLHNYDICM